MKILQSIESPRKRGRPLTYEEKRLVFHVFETVLKGKQDQAISQIEDPYNLTSQYTGVGRSIVAKIAKSVRDTGTVPPSISPGNRRQSTAIPPLVEGRIREFVFEQHRQGAVCNATHLRAFLQDAFGITVPERTVRRHLSRMGVWWIRTKHKPRSLREKAEIRQQRHDYLYELRQNRQRSVAERYRVVYLDERFLHHPHGAQFSWFSEGDFVERSCGKGRRWCFIHAMQQAGLIDGAFLIFEANAGTGDYHKQFDWSLFQRWFTEQLLPQLPPRCLIVLDRCRFHRVTKDSLLPHQMRKAELREWLTERGLHWEEKWLRARLTEEVDKHRDKKPMIEVFAEEQGQRVLFLPVHHPELNPIELVWATAKNHCGTVFSKHTTFQDPRQHLEESLKRDITPEYCVNLYEHVHQIEDKYWEADLALDDELESTLEDSDLFCETM